MSMTINQLHKLTAKLIAQGAGRRQVLVAKDTFKHVLESDGCTILPVESAEMEVFPIADDDGGSAFLADGREKTQAGLVLRGDWKEA